MRAKNRTAKWFWVLWLMSIPLLGWSLSKTPLDEIWAVISRLKLAQILSLVGVNIIILLLVSYRWRMILSAMGERVPFRRLFSYRLTSFGVSYFTPGPQFGGEPLQVVLLSRNHAVRVVNAVSSVYTDKLLELLVNVFVIVAGTGFALGSGLGNGVFNQTAWIVVLVLAVIPVGHLIALRNHRLPLNRLISGFGWDRSPTVWLKKAAQVVGESEKKIAQFLISHPDILFMALFVSFLSWLGMILEYLLVIRFLGLELNVSQSIFAFVLSRIAFLAPLPAGLGALEASQVLAVQTVGLSAAAGLALTLWMRLRDVLIGLIGIGLGGFSLRDVARSAHEEVNF